MMTAVSESRTAQTAATSAAPMSVTRQPRGRAAQRGQGRAESDADGVRTEDDARRAPFVFETGDTEGDRQGERHQQPVRAPGYEPAGQGREQAGGEEDNALPVTWTRGSTTSTCSAAPPSSFPTCPAACGPYAIRTPTARSDRGAPGVSAGRWGCRVRLRSS